MIKLQQNREEVFKNIHAIQDQIKNIYDKRTKAYDFQIRGLVLDGMLEMRRKENMGNMRISGRGPSKFLLSIETVLTCQRT